MDIKDIMVNLCGQMIDTNKSVARLSDACGKAVAAQNRNNRSFAICIVGIIGYIVYSEFRHADDTAKIEQLSNDIAQLKDVDAEDQYE